MKKTVVVALLITLMVTGVVGCGEDGSYARDSRDLRGEAIIQVRISSMHINDVEKFIKETEITDEHDPFATMRATTKLGEKYVDACRTLYEKQVEYFVEHWEEKDSITERVLEEALDKYYQECYRLSMELSEKAEEEKSER